MTLPLWAVIGLTFLATLGIYKTVQVWRRDMELLGRKAHIQELIDEVCALEGELDEWEREYKDVARMKRMEGNDEAIR